MPDTKTKDGFRDYTLLLFNIFKEITDLDFNT